MLLIQGCDVLHQINAKEYLAPAVLAATQNNRLDARAFAKSDYDMQSQVLLTKLPAGFFEKLLVKVRRCYVHMDFSQTAAAFYGCGLKAQLWLRHTLQHSGAPSGKNILEGAQISEDCWVRVNETFGSKGIEVQRDLLGKVTTIYSNGSAKIRFEGKDHTVHAKNFGKMSVVENDCPTRSIVALTIITSTVRQMDHIEQFLQELCVFFPGMCSVDEKGTLSLGIKLVETRASSHEPIQVQIIEATNQEAGKQTSLPFSEHVKQVILDLHKKNSDHSEVLSVCTGWRQVHDLQSRGTILEVWQKEDTEWQKKDTDQMRVIVVVMNEYICFPYIRKRASELLMETVSMLRLSDIKTSLKQLIDDAEAGLNDKETSEKIIKQTAHKILELKNQVESTFDADKLQELQQKREDKEHSGSIRAMESSTERDILEAAELANFARLEGDIKCLDMLQADLTDLLKPLQQFHAAVDAKLAIIPVISKGYKFPYKEDGSPDYSCWWPANMSELKNHALFVDLRNSDAKDPQIDKFLRELVPQIHKFLLEGHAVPKSFSEAADKIICLQCAKEGISQPHRFSRRVTSSKLLEAKREQVHEMK